MYYVALAAIKIIDNIISTEKTILTNQHRAVASSVLVVISQLIFYFIVREVVSDGSVVAIIVIALASGIGNYFAFGIHDKIKKQDVWVNIVTANDKEQMKRFGDYVRAEGIKIVMFDAFNDDKEMTLTAMVFPESKEESSKIDKYVDGHEGFFREVV